VTATQEVALSFGDASDFLRSFYLASESCWMGVRRCAACFSPGACRPVSALPATASL